MKIVLTFFLLISFKFSYGQNTAKPWAYWWWPGSAVNEKDIAQNLKLYAEAGFGGMHIIPIYGVKGEESKFIPYLSPRWLEILDFTCKEAKKLNLGIDMSLGTGWPFGGPWVSPAEAAKTLEIKEGKITFKPTGQKVKRAAPGGEGLVVDHFDKLSVMKHLGKFDSIFTGKNYGVRAFYNDSYEVYGANWTADFPSKFLKLRNYNILDHVSALEKKTTYTATELRIRADYQETISDLLSSEFTKPYAALGAKHGKLTRNESHGSPANILDLYAITDIPETEFFGSKPYDIKYYKQDEDYEEKRFGKPNWKVLKLASSPAHLLKKPLVSSETATWLGNHFKVSLSQIKPIIDESFIGGVNHIFYHGVPYSPPSEPFPGWLFYASTNFNPQSHFWQELPLLNKYVENCQSILQHTTADNEILVYLPFHDLWNKPSESVKLIDIHNLENSGLFTPKLIKLLDLLKSKGYQFDFISDNQIQQLKKNSDGKFGIKNFTYKTLIIPEIKVLPLLTLKKLESLKRTGLELIFENKTPVETSGFKDFDENQTEFEKLKLEFYPSEDVIKSLQKIKVYGEKISDLGLEFIRKTNKNGPVYFISNQSYKFEKGKISLNKDFTNPVLFDPLTNKEYKLDQKNLLLNLPAGKSVFIYNKKEIHTPYKITENKNTLDLSKNWEIEINSSNLKLDTLGSWTNLSINDIAYFHGVAIYRKEFSINKNLVKNDLELDLGDVQASAEVFLNRKSLGVTWSLPHKIKIPKNLISENNSIEIRVKNTSFNKVRKLDKEKIIWKKFYDINMVDIRYTPFDASIKPPQVSGLLGPVILKY